MEVLLEHTMNHPKKPPFQMSTVLLQIAGVLLTMHLNKCVLPISMFKPQLFTGKWYCFTFKRKKVDKWLPQCVVKMNTHYSLYRQCYSRTPPEISKS